MRKTLRLFRTPAEPCPQPWPKKRRYLLARLLLAPARQLASVTSTDDRHTPVCICGWQGAGHAHRRDAFSEAHVHTRHVRTGPDNTSESGAARNGATTWFAD
jgi:hypothetical protein